jgi:hypothetical protein
VYISSLRASRPKDIFIHSGCLASTLLSSLFSIPNMYLRLSSYGCFRQKGNLYVLLETKKVMWKCCTLTLHKQNIKLEYLNLIPHIKQPHKKSLGVANGSRRFGPTIETAESARFSHQATRDYDCKCCKILCCWMRGLHYTVVSVRDVAIYCRYVLIDRLGG